MTDTPENRTVIQRLIDIAAEVPPMEKRQVQTFKAFAVDDVYSTLRPLFVKHGVVLIPNVVAVEYVERSRGGDKSPSIDARVTMDYTFHAADGSEVTMRFCAEGRDVSDKATNKAVQQALKYACVQLFMISTGEVDPDAETVENGFVAEPAEDQPAEVPPSLAEKRMKKVKDAAWQHTTGEKDDRIVETKRIVAQVVAAYGGEPENQTDVDALIANIAEMFTEEDNNE